MVVRINARVEEIFGFDRSELLGQSIDLLLPERFRAGHVGYRQSYQQSPRLRSMGLDLELLGRRKNGKEFPVDVMLSPIKIDDEWLVICAVRDITEQKHIQSELSEVQHRLVESQEEERLRLAQELHDNTIQELFSISFQLDDIERCLIEGSLDKVENGLQESRKMVQHTILGLRNISGELRPPTLAPFGLEPAIQSHLERFQELHPNITIYKELTYDGQVLDERLKLSLFRIYQNAVSNVARHAQAEKLWVRLDLDDEKVILDIKDDGKGFDVPTRWVDLARQGHLGLIGTRERVKAIGGKLDIVSSPGKGMHVRVTVPLKRDC
jgi:PAS domain S-box-containing protein